MYFVIYFQIKIINLCFKRIERGRVGNLINSVCSPITDTSCYLLDVKFPNRAYCIACNTVVFCLFSIIIHFLFEI